MGRVIRYWVAFGVLSALVMYGGGYAAFQLIDLTFLQFATVFCVPLLQATVLVWREEQPARLVATVSRAALHHPLAQPVLILDGLILGAGIIWWHAPAIGLGAGLNVHLTWTLVKGIAATVLVLREVLRSAGGERVSLLLHAVAPVLLIFAIEPSTSWLAAASDEIRARVGSSGEVLQRLALYVPAFSLLIVMTLRSAGVLSRRSQEAGALVQAAVAAALIVAVTVVLASFNLPVVVQPWLGLATLAASLAASCLCLATIFLATGRSAQR